MKTRTLLLLSLACGLAIMLAGAAFLFQLTTQDDAEPPVPIGEVAGVGDMSVTVESADESGGSLTVTITIGGADDPDPTDGFRLIASARPVPLDSTTCGASAAGSESCTLRFDVSGVDGVSRVLFYERGDDRARWQLS